MLPSASANADARSRPPPAPPDHRFGADRRRRERGWNALSFYSDASGDDTADYVGDRDADWPAYTVLHKTGGMIPT